MDKRARHTILVVDDEPNILQSLQALLRLDYQVLTADSGPEGLAILDKTDVQVVMSDQRMPGMSGVEFLGHVRRSHPFVVRVIFTGYADIHAVIDAINLGAVYRYVTKPWAPEQLQAVLRQCLARWEQIQERQRLLEDLRRAHAQQLALFDALRQGKFGTLSSLGRAEAARLAGSGRALLESLDRVLEVGAEQSVD
jgi:DNA-binding NtrC family response regulator